MKTRPWLLQPRLCGKDQALAAAAKAVFAQYYYLVEENSLGG